MMSGATSPLSSSKRSLICAPLYGKKPFLNSSMRTVFRRIPPRNFEALSWASRARMTSELKTTQYTFTSGHSLAKRSIVPPQPISISSQWAPRQRIVPRVLGKRLITKRSSVGWVDGRAVSQTLPCRSLLFKALDLLETKAFGVRALEISSVPVDDPIQGFGGHKPRLPSQLKSRFARIQAQATGFVRMRAGIPDPGRLARPLVDQTLNHLLHRESVFLKGSEIPGTRISPTFRIELLRQRHISP